MTSRTFSTSELIAEGVIEIGDGYRAKNSEMGIQGLPFVRAGDVDGRVNTVGTDVLATEHLGKVGRKVSQPGDVVITTKGTVGRLAFVKAGDSRFVYSPQLCYWRSLDHSRIHPDWLFYALQSAEFRHQVSWSAGQTDMAPYVSLTDQRTAFKLSIPELSKQIAIGATLRSFDDKIEANRRMNETLEAMARALFRDWFIDFGPTRAKMEGREPYLASDIWSLFPDRLDDEGKPEGWAKVPASSLVEFNPSERIAKGAIAPYLDMAGLPTSGPCCDQPIPRAFKSGAKFRSGDTLMARITPCLENGKTGFVQDVWT